MRKSSPWSGKAGVVKAVTRASGLPAQMPTCRALPAGRATPAAPVSSPKAKSVTSGEPSLAMSRATAGASALPCRMRTRAWPAAPAAKASTRGNTRKASAPPVGESRPMATAVITASSSMLRSPVS